VCASETRFYWVNKEHNTVPFRYQSDRRESASQRPGQSQERAMPTPQVIEVRSRARPQNAMQCRGTGSVAPLPRHAIQGRPVVESPAAHIAGP